MIFSKDGFDFTATTNAITNTESVAPKSASEWLVTINDSLVTLTGSRAGSVTFTACGAPPAFIACDEAACYDQAVCTTAWSDYTCPSDASVQSFKVGRTGLYAALQAEQHATDLDGEGCDPDCCDEEGDYIGAQIEAQNQRLIAMEAMMSSMRPNINAMQMRLDAMERDLNHERSMRYMAEHQLRTVEADLKETKSLVEYARYVATDTSAIVHALEGTTSGISSRVTVLEQMESLSMPSKSFDDGATVEHYQHVSWKLESGRSTIRGVQPTVVHQDEISFHNQDASVNPNDDLYMINPTTGIITIKAGKMASSLVVGTAALSTSTPYGICAHPGDVYQ